MKGFFVSRGLRLTPEVYALKPQDGYPEADPAHSEENQSGITLSADKPSGSVVISLCKAGVVTLEVKDKATGKPMTVLASMYLTNLSATERVRVREYCSVWNGVVVREQ